VGGVLLQKGGSKDGKFSLNPREKEQGGKEKEGKHIYKKRNREKTAVNVEFIEG